ncbi:glycosyltransferase [Candidatus Pacearchaeota archaeon]|nr:glycosyltransferase [Candidatus Pacearchaeota archaeon]
MKKRFSIVIALAPWRDAEILSSIQTLDYPKKNFEVIIIKGLNVPDNRNNGVKKAKGEIIVFLDDDAIIEKDFLKKIDSFLDDHKEISIVGGAQITPKSDKFFARVSGYVLEDPFGAPGVNRRYRKSKLNLNADHDYISGVNLTVRKSVFKKLKFDRELYPGDDVAFVKKAKKLGLKVGYSPEIFVYHRRRPTLKALVKQIFDYAIAKTKWDLKKELQAKPLFIIPSLFVLYILTLPFLLALSRLFILPLIAYVILALVFSFYESVRNRNFPAFFILPFIFFIVHVTYGLGFLGGFLNKIFHKTS